MKKSIQEDQPRWYQRSKKHLYLDIVDPVHGQHYWFRFRDRREFIDWFTVCTPAESLAGIYVDYFWDIYPIGNMTSSYCKFCEKIFPLESFHTFYIREIQCPDCAGELDFSDKGEPAPVNELLEWRFSLELEYDSIRIDPNRPEVPGFFSDIVNFAKSKDYTLVGKIKIAAAFARYMFKYFKAFSITTGFEEGLPQSVEEELTKIKQLRDSLMRNSSDA